MAACIDTEKIWLPELNYPILMTRKRIKNMYLRVNSDTGEVQLSAPLKMNKRDILLFVCRNLSWLKDRRQKTLSHRPPKLRYTTGELIPLWGKNYPLTVMVTAKENSKSDVQFKSDKIILAVSPDSTIVERRELIRLLYRRELMAAITATRREHEKNVGQIAYEYHVRDMKTRWGTCNVRARRIWLSLYLAQYHPRALAYVMVHELTHLLERSHNARFWRLVEDVCPNWREIRRELTEPPTK